ncbi:MAG: NAD(P)H-dependent glycerol-3-phosphate dehydrogenase [Zetaproteobacteria bacterium]|nr:MAG: NAD(P)H-dependent glycerol-3-phosphate dehydrogenase [Zetaproteobacteria bacterium]
MSNISIIGAGAWGSALAQVISTHEKDVTLWTRTQTLADEINALHMNKPYLGDIQLSPHINATSSLEIALESSILLMVTPAQAIRTVLSSMKPFIRNDHVLILCSKGIEAETGLLTSDITKDILPNTPCAVLSGPNFAHEIAAGKPAATTLACADEDLAETLQKAIASAYFRPYISHDIIGTQIAGSLKNIIAIACGIAHGMNMGESARASLVTRGLAEIARLGVAMGANQNTFLGLCGVGDMMLTCSSEKSRNFSLGFALGSGTNIKTALNNSKGIAEGFYTAKAATMLAKKYNVDMPISATLYKCLHESLPLELALNDMMHRPLGNEL